MKKLKELMRKLKKARESAQTEAQRARDLRLAKLKEARELELKNRTRQGTLCSRDKGQERGRSTRT